MTNHQFGGTWTEDKLTRLKKYLVAYRKILRRYPYFTTWYVDAFAGNGERAFAAKPVQPSIFVEVYTDVETADYLDGSARIALGLQEPFDRYLFIDKLPSRLAELQQSIFSDFPQIQPRCTLLPGDANVLLKSWCRERDWKKERAVVFLDPYGMQVEWETVELLAATKAVDLWYLFPLGIGALRLLTRTGEMEEGWKKRLDALLGTPEWRTRFYEADSSMGLFEDMETKKRTATAEQVRDFLQERLRLLFPGVAEGLMLTNSRNCPMYLLCFASANERGAPTAIKIAKSILKG